MLPGRWGGKKWEAGIKKGHQETLGRDGHATSCEFLVVSQVCMCVGACRIVHCKYVKCTVKWLDANKAVFEIVSRKRCPICPCSVFYLPYQLLVVKDDHTQSCSCSAIRPLLGQILRILCSFWKQRNYFNWVTFPSQLIDKLTLFSCL